jgi:hypothetical protein
MGTSCSLIIIVFSNLATVPIGEWHKMAPKLSGGLMKQVILRSDLMG